MTLPGDRTAIAVDNETLLCDVLVDVARGTLENEHLDFIQCVGSEDTKSCARCHRGRVAIDALRAWGGVSY